jgi:hypothetical protein
MGTQMRYPRKINAPFENTGIKQMGIRTFDTAAEFKAIKLSSDEKINSKDTNNKEIDSTYYYPLSMLALSRVGYNTFVGDSDRFLL